MSSLPIRAAELTASDGGSIDYFGVSGSFSGTFGLVGASADNSNQGSAYLFRNLDTAGGAITEDVRLTASDGAGDDIFGYSMSLSGSTGLIEAERARIGANSTQGTVYLFRNLDTANGSITENAKLTASDGATGDSFGGSVGVSGTTGLVGAYYDDVGANLDQGSAYVFRNLDTASGTVTQNVKLTASDGARRDFFGYFVSLSSTIGLVGAYADDIGASNDQGSAYVFRDLDTASGVVTENVKLTASDGATGDLFGGSVSLSGAIGLVGAYTDNVGAYSDQGSAYLFRNLDTAGGVVTQNLKLTASDGAASDQFGYSVSLSGTTGIVGAYQDDIGGNSNQGSAYLFTNLDTASGAATQSVKLTASGGGSNDQFGFSVSLDGDNFLIGAVLGDGLVVNSGKAYSGSVSSVTTLDEGNVSRTISGISFTSQDDWIIGENTDSNTVTLSAGDTATVTATGMTVAIGENAGSDLNTLFIKRTLNANTIIIGTAGSFGNLLKLASTADVNAAAVILADGNSLAIEGDFTAPGALLGYLGGTTLQTSDGTDLTTITNENQTDYLGFSYSGGYTTFSPIPEPSTALLLIGGGLVAGFRRRRN